MTRPPRRGKLVVKADGGGPNPRLEKERHISQRNQAEAGAIDEEDVGRLRSMMGRQPTGFGTRKKRAKKPGGEGETSTMASSFCRASTSASKRETRSRRETSVKDAGDGRVRGGGRRSREQCPTSTGKRPLPSTRGGSGGSSCRSAEAGRGREAAEPRAAVGRWKKRR